jgi:excisionase family DNA binding protein
MEKKESAVSLPLLTISETAKYLGIGRKMVYQLIDLGEIKAVKVGRSIAIEEKSLDKYLSSGKRI